MTVDLYARPERLEGRTYVIRPPHISHSIYITINDLVMEDGRLRPYEIFINSKDVTHLEWMMAMSRLMSALLRQSAPYNFMIEELLQIQDPHGGYRDGRLTRPGIVAHIAAILKNHIEHRA